MFEQNDNNNDVKTLLEKDTTASVNKPWNKLEKNIKIKLLNAYANDFCTANSDNSENSEILKKYFINCIAQNRLTKITDVIYNKETMKITDIPGLYYNNTNHNFSIRNSGKKSILSSLTPKKNKTKRNNEKDTKKLN